MSDEYTTKTVDNLSLVSGNLADVPDAARVVMWNPAESGERLRAVEWSDWTDYFASQLDAAAIKTLYESNADTNAFTDAEQTKLGYIDVTQNVDLDAIETRVNELDAAVVLVGTWDATSGNFPGGGSAQAGHSYIVSVGGTVDSITFNADDRIVAITDNASDSTYSGNWHKLDYTDLVTSVVGQTGVVSAGDIWSGLAAQYSLFADRALVTGPSGLEVSATTSDQIGYLSTLTGNVQTQLDGKLANVSEDTTPQLGGNLDVNGQSIVSTSDGDITLAPDGSGNVVAVVDGTGTFIVRQQGGTPGTDQVEIWHSGAASYINSAQGGIEFQEGGTKIVAIGDAGVAGWGTVTVGANRARLLGGANGQLEVSGNGGFVGLGGSIGGLTVVQLTHVANGVVGLGTSNTNSQHTIGNSDQQQTAASDTDGADCILTAESGGTHSSNNPNGGDFRVIPGAEGSGGSGSAGVFAVGQPGGTPGTDEVQISHDGTDTRIESMSGDIQLGGQANNTDYVDCYTGFRVSNGTPGGGANIFWASGSQGVRVNPAFGITDNNTNWQLSSGGLSLGSDTVVLFSSTVLPYQTKDLGLSRLSAGVLGITDGTNDLFSIGSSDQQQTAASDTDGADLHITAENGGFHYIANPDGGDIVWTPGAAGSGGAGLAGVVNINGSLVQPVSTLAEFTANQTDLDLSDKPVVRVSSDASRNVYSLHAGRDGEVIEIHNVGSNDVVLIDDDGSTGTAAQRFVFPGGSDVTIAGIGCATVRYDATTARWRLVSKNF